MSGNWPVGSMIYEWELTMSLEWASENWPHLLNLKFTAPTACNHARMHARTHAHARTHVYGMSYFWAIVWARGPYSDHNL